MRSCPKCCTTYTTDVVHCSLDGEELIEDLIDPMIGQIIDRYEIVDCLGEGAMAAVYRARHQVIEREVACKVLFGEYASDKQFAERFRREAQAASKVKHPNVVDVLDFGQTPGGATFLLMELLEGHTLQEGIEAQGAFNPRRAAAVVRDIAAGLRATHAAGLIHRDLKPGNIMLTRDSEGRELAKILDFGVVQNFGDGRLTNTGQTLGTPYYMSPEQVGGNADLGPASDLYSLGVVIYEMLRGQAPFRGSFGEVLVKHVTEKAEALPEAGGLEHLAERLMEKAVDKRPASADEVIELIDELELGGRVPFFSLQGGSGPRPAAPDDSARTSSKPFPASMDKATVEAPRPDLLQAVRNRTWIPAVVVIFALMLAIVIANAGAPTLPSEETPVPAKKPDYAVEVEAALRARGLSRVDTENLKEVKPLMVAWQEARERGKGEDAVVASLLRAVARTSLDVEMLEAKVKRVRVFRKGAPRQLRERIDAIPLDLDELANAERSQLARELDALERGLSGK